MNMQLYGVVGRVAKVDQKSGKVKVEFDKETEENKIHDAFFGQRVLKDESLLRREIGKRYYADSQIEQLLQLPRGVINKITSSFLVTFNDKEKFERAVVDLGLNIKNYTKKVHVPDFVRYVADPDDIADYQFDDYQHN